VHVGGVTAASAIDVGARGCDDVSHHPIRVP
jgi:hypothetical protein